MGQENHFAAERGRETFDRQRRCLVVATLSHHKTDMISIA
jgi:hypothetical protein